MSAAPRSRSSWRSSRNPRSKPQRATSRRRSEVVMNRLRAVLGAALLAAPVSAQDEAMSSDFYPLRKGTTWTYKVSTGTTLVTQVTAHEKVGKDVCAKLETKLNGETVATEHV